MHDALRFELTNRYHAPGIKTTLLLPGHIRTPLFDRIQFPRSLFFRFMAPSLQPEEVVAGIMDELYHQRNGVVRMPFYTQTVRFLNIGTGLVPEFIRNFLQWVSTISCSGERCQCLTGVHSDDVAEPSGPRYGFVQLMGVYFKCPCNVLLIPLYYCERWIWIT